MTPHEHYIRDVMYQTCCCLSYFPIFGYETVQFYNFLNFKITIFIKQGAIWFYGVTIFDSLG
jgi:hypothetical protein